MFNLYFELLLLVCIILVWIEMCLHPIAGYDALNRPIDTGKYQHKLDNCDYYETTNPIDAQHGDLLAMQLNIHGLFNKLSNLKDLVNRASCSKKADVI